MEHELVVELRCLVDRERAGRGGRGERGEGREGGEGGGERGGDTIGFCE